MDTRDQLSQRLNEKWHTTHRELSGTVVESLTQASPASMYCVFEHLLLLSTGSNPEDPS